MHQGHARATLAWLSQAQPKAEPVNAGQESDPSRGTNRKQSFKEPELDKQARASGRDNLLEQLFVSSIHPNRNSRQHTRPTHPSSSFAREQRDLLKDVEHLLSREDDDSLLRAWEQLDGFYGAFGPMSCDQLSDEDTRSKELVFGRLLRATATKYIDGDKTGLPLPYQAVQTFSRLGVMQDSYLETTLWTLLHPVIVSRLLRSDSQSPNDSVSLNGILDCLKVSLQSGRNRPRIRQLTSSNLDQVDWSDLPDVASVGTAGKDLPEEFTNRLFYLLPGLTSVRSRRGIALAVLVTFDLLNPAPGREMSDISDPTTSKRFSLFVAQLLNGARFEMLESKEYLVANGLPHDVVEQLWDGWQNIDARALALLPHTVERSRKLASMTDSELKTLFMKQLSRALERQDLPRTDVLWKKVQHGYSPSAQNRPVTEVKDGEHGASMPLSLYNRFMMVYMALRRPDRAIDVWNDMMSRGIEPSQASWHALLEGCRTARDAKSLQDVWDRMLAAGIKPDLGCWTTLIHGFIQSGKWETGIMALNEMWRSWLQASKKARKGMSGQDVASLDDIDGVVRPTIETVNATVSALLNRQKTNAARNVLAWASSLGFKPDLVTYNTLLRPAVRSGRPADAMLLLQQMEAQDIQPDIVTFTIILDGLFRSNVPSSAVDQTATVSRVLSDMEAHGVPANAHSYSTLVSNLLKPPALNEPAARAVLAHMSARGLPPSPQIYTVLAAHHFGQTPPDLAAVAALWARIRRERAPVDLVFYDRVVRGYAEHGDARTARTFLIRMRDEGKPWAWEPLTAVLRGLLLAAADRGAAAELVAEVRANTHGVRGHKGEGRFWDLAAEVGG